jgi:hypothetical protein
MRIQTIKENQVSATCKYVIVSTTASSRLKIYGQAFFASLLSASLAGRHVLPAVDDTVSVVIDH